MIRSIKNGTLIYDSYKGKILFNMKEFVSFEKYRQSMFYMSIRELFMFPPHTTLGLNCAVPPPYMSFYKANMTRI